MLKKGLFKNSNSNKQTNYKDYKALQHLLQVKSKPEFSEKKEEKTVSQDALNEEQQVCLDETIQLHNLFHI